MAHYCSDNKDVFYLMDQEHKFVHKLYELFKSILTALKAESNPPKEDLKKMLKLLHLYGDVYHHGKEEQILFPEADKNGIVGKQGGPHCSLFFGKYLQNDHLPKIKALSKKYPTILPYKASKDAQALLDKNSPLCIPLNEHEVSYYANQIMKEELKKGDSWSKAYFLKAADIYLQMLADHIKKEDECLLVVLQKNFSEKTKLYLYDLFEEFNHRHEDILHQAKDIFIDLQARY
ncbi:MAG: hemerythrin domain-containing protein [Bdellovibrionales bacterium]|nr:hemerythrin domain-containing protein [Bdellovibrionales bacterium]